MIKNINNIKKIIALLLLANITVFTNCSKPSPSPAPPETEVVTNILKSKQWTIQSVSIDGAVSNSFQNMTLSFTNTNYNTTNGGVVWPTSGTWSFNDTSGKSFKRNDNVDVIIESISGTSLSLSMQWTKTTLGTGRLESTSGKYTFTFR